MLFLAMSPAACGGLSSYDVSRFCRFIFIWRTSFAADADWLFIAMSPAAGVGLFSYKLRRFCRLIFIWRTSFAADADQASIRREKSPKEPFPFFMAAKIAAGGNC